MNKKIFRAANIQEALANIKEEMGAEAMILSTRKIPRRPLDPYAKDMFEVEAGVKEDPFAKEKGATQVEKENLIASLKGDISEIRDMISIAGFGSGIQTILCRHFESVGVLASFLRAGVSERLAIALIEKAGDCLDPNLEQTERITLLKKNVMTHCLDRLSVKDFFNRNNRSGVPHVAAFVGPTGVGKTTTIAKLAALLSLKRKMKVGLISIDNYRIGAFEQLKAYASIMGLLCVPAFSAQDLSCALERMKSMDVVLIDTAGHSHFDKQKIDEILQLIKSDFGISVHLTLSVTSESINMKEAASAFSVFNPDTYVFTKIDETKRCGKILDQVNNLNLPVSLITNGQKVPEDLIVPDKQTLLRIILGKGPKGEV
ncbi:MAG: protein FlhF [Proteobacteria bacterium]|nr:protein FlhF [Desulfobacula sp.]MBU3954478.1 protein FlhF [Pseudomonadota bacterium]MBU4130885.1 protein FlhF [Pseudomonadota bacterium]